MNRLAENILNADRITSRFKDTSRKGLSNIPAYFRTKRRLSRTLSYRLNAHGSFQIDVYSIIFSLYQIWKKNSKIWNDHWRDLKPQKLTKIFKTTFRKFPSHLILYQNFQKVGFNGLRSVFPHRSIENKYWTLSTGISLKC